MQTASIRSATRPTPSGAWRGRYGALAPEAPTPPLAARGGVAAEPAALASDRASPAAEAMPWATADFHESVYAARRADVVRVSRGDAAVPRVVSAAVDDGPADGIDPVAVYARRAAVVAAAAGR